MREDCVFFQSLRVRFQEVDQQGVVWNGHYAGYLEVALDGFFRRFGDPEEKAESRDQNVDFVYRKVAYEYFASAVEGDDLEIGVRVMHIGTTSFRLRFEFYRRGEEAILVSADTVSVAMDLDVHKSRPLTTGMRSVLEKALKAQG